MRREAYDERLEYDLVISNLVSNDLDWKAGDYLIVEHLTRRELKNLGEDTQSHGVVRLWLADDADGTNRKRLIDLKLGEDDPALVLIAKLEVCRWADGFVLASTLRGEPVRWRMLNFKDPRHSRRTAEP